MISTNVPLYLEKTAFQYMLGIYTQNSFMIEETLKKHVTTTVYANINGDSLESSTRFGRDAVVQGAMEAGRLIRSIEQIKVKFGLYTDNDTTKLAINYGQELTDDNSSSAANWQSEGLLLWKWKDIKDYKGEITAIFTKGTEYTKACVSMFSPDPETFRWDEAKNLPKELDENQRSFLGCNLL